MGLLAKAAEHFYSCYLFCSFCNLTKYYTSCRKHTTPTRSITMRILTTSSRLLWLRVLLMSAAIFGVTPLWSKPLPSGFFELRPYPDTIAGVTASHAWSRSDMAGVAIRVYWNSIQPTSSSEYDWSYIDAVATLAANYRKQFSINVTGGLNAPAWVYASGTDGKGSAKFTISGTKVSGVMPAPWDLNFQRRWSAFLVALANRYDLQPTLSYVIVTGQGWGGQATFCQSSTDDTELNSDGGVTVWVNAFVSITGAYVSSGFVQTPLIVNIGAPLYPNQLGGFKTASDQCVTTYGARYGIKSNALSPNYKTTDWQAREIKALSGSHPAGFQMLLPSKTAADLVKAIQIGESLGSNLFEVYPPDLNLVSNFSSL